MRHHRAETEEEILICGDASVDARQQAGMVGVRKDTPLLFPDTGKPALGCGKRQRSQLGLIELDIELACAIAHPRLAALQPGKPEFGIVALEPVRYGTGDRKSTRLNSSH